MSTPTRYDDHPLAERVRENLAELAEATLVLRRWDEVPVVSMVPRARRRWVVAVVAAVVAAALVVATVVVVRVATGGRTVKPATPSGAEAPSRFVFDPPEGYREGFTQEPYVREEGPDVQPNPDVESAREGFACVEYKVETGAVHCDAVGGATSWGASLDEADANGSWRQVVATTLVAPKRADLSYLDDAPKVIQVRGHEGWLVVVGPEVVGPEYSERNSTLVWEERPGVLVALAWESGVEHDPGDWLLEIAENGRMETLGTSAGLPIAIKYGSAPLDLSGLASLLPDVPDEVLAPALMQLRLWSDPFGTGREDDWLAVRRTGDRVQVGRWHFPPLWTGSGFRPDVVVDPPLGNRLDSDTFHSSVLTSGDTSSGTVFGAVPTGAVRVRVELRDGHAVDVDTRGTDLGYGVVLFVAEWSRENRSADDNRVDRVVALAADGGELASFERQEVPERPRTLSTLETPPPYTDDVAIASRGTVDGRMTWRLAVRPIYRGLCLGLGVGEPAPTTCIDKLALDAVLDGTPIGLVEDELSLVAGLVSDRVETVRVVFTDGSSVDLKPVRPSEVLTDPDLLAFAVEVPAGESVERIDAVDSRGVTDSSAKPIVPASG